MITIHQLFCCFGSVIHTSIKLDAPIPDAHLRILHRSAWRNAKMGTCCGRIQSTSALLCMPLTLILTLLWPSSTRMDPSRSPSLSMRYVQLMHESWLQTAYIYIYVKLMISSLYQDFAHYKSGVYSHITGDALGGHAVKLIGWGTTQNGEDYWVRN